MYYYAYGSNLSSRYNGLTPKYVAKLVALRRSLDHSSDSNVGAEEVGDATQQLA